MSEDVEETNAGVKKKGDLEEVAGFARDVEKVMDEEIDDSKSIERFRDWRPREDDSKEDIRKKTVEAATVPEKELEEKSDGKRDIAKAGEKALSGGKKLKKGKKPAGDFKEASRRFVRPFYSVSAKITRKLEEKVYSDLMLKFNPYFFDTEDFSADLRMSKGQYVFDVGVADKNSRDCLKQRFVGN